MTYRLFTEFLIQRIHNLAGDVTFLKDSANEKEKSKLNAAEQSLSNAQSYLQQLCEEMGSRENMELD